MKKKDLEVLCPDCGSRLRIDQETGAVTAHGRGERPKDLGEVVRGLEERHKAKSNAFDEALDAERKHKDQLEDLFRKAQDKNRQDDGTRPDNPLDDRWR